MPFLKKNKQKKKLMSNRLQYLFLWVVCCKYNRLAVISVKDD